MINFSPPSTSLIDYEMNEKIYSINGKFFSGLENEIFPYKVTGIIGGKWVGEIVEPLFKKHNIRINYSKRGFYKKVTRKEGNYLW